MLWTILVILLVLWLLGGIGGGLIHLFACGCGDSVDLQPRQRPPECDLSGKERTRHEYCTLLSFTTALELAVAGSGTLVGDDGRFECNRIGRFDSFDCIGYR